MVSLKKYQTYETFRAVEDAWLNSLPSDWKLTRLQFGSSIRNSGVDKKIVEGEELIKLCNYVDVYYHDTIDDSIDFMEASATPEEIENFRLREGDVIMTKDSESPNDIGIPAFVSKDFDDVICGYHLCVLKTFRNKLEPKFLFYFLKSTFAQSKFEIYSNGVTRFGLSYNGIKTLPVPVPSLKEQQSIATFLDKKTKQIDDLIEQKEKLLQLLTEKRTAIITQAVTKGLNPKVKMKDSGIEWLGEVPEHWEVMKLKYVGRMRSGESITSLTITDFDKYPVYGGNGLRGYTSNYTHSGDFILIGRQGALCGNINYACGKFWASEHAVVLTRKKNIDILWLGELLRIMNLNQYSISAAQPGLAIDRIEALEIPVPPQLEQVEIGKFITNLEGAKKLEVKIDLSIKLLKEYRSSLVTAAVTGQIDVREEVIV